jgi:hypothetical protein
VRFGHISVSVGLSPCSYILDWVAVWSGQVRVRSHLRASLG